MFRDVHQASRVNVPQRPNFGATMILPAGGWRAHVAQDFLAQGVAIHLGRFHDGQPRETVAPTELEMQTWGDGVVTEPWLRLPDDAARALLDALAATYGGTSDLRQLRADYEAERRRVDKLLDRMAPIGVRPVTP